MDMENNKRKEIYKGLINNTKLDINIIETTSTLQSDKIVGAIVTQIIKPLVNKYGIHVSDDASYVVKKEEDNTVAIEFIEGNNNISIIIPIIGRIDIDTLIMIAASYAVTLGLKYSAPNLKIKENEYQNLQKLLEKKITMVNK